MGFEIGSHGYLHEKYTQHDNQWIKIQVAKAEAAIYDVTGIHTKLIRLPYGDLNEGVLKKLAALKYTTIQWSIDTLDWTNPGIEVIENRVLSNNRPGDIILMHASDTAEQTIAALPRIIEGLSKYRLVTVSELLKNA